MINLSTDSTLGGQIAPEMQKATEKVLKPRQTNETCCSQELPQPFQDLPSKGEGGMLTEGAQTCSLSPAQENRKDSITPLEASLMGYRLLPARVNTGPLLLGAGQ